MDNATIFSLASGIATLGWVALIFLNRPWRFRVAMAVCIPLLAALYAVLVLPALTGISFMDFASLEGVLKLMGNEEATLVGWIHYLAFDLLVGWVIATDAEKMGLNRWLVVPALLFTFMLGPVGWLLYLLIRLSAKRGWVVAS